MRKKRIPIAMIAALVVAVAVTSVFAYYETWEDWWWSEGNLYYEGYTYTKGTDELYMCDSTDDRNVNDLFYLKQDGGVIPFVCSQRNDTIYLSIDKEDVEADKPTGQLSTKYATGTWEGVAYVVSDDDSFDVSGTVDGTFDYTGLTWTWDGEAEVTNSNPSGITGEGSGDGDLECSSSSAPCGSCQ
ncbi:hypothetical protein GF338_02615 [candidate division WOR-3 bacterium]|nr:hypothetical protein [candidate division WOR-3 bacterium]